VLAALFGAGFLTLLVLALLALLVNASFVYLAARLTGLRGRFRVACKTTLVGWMLAIVGGVGAGFLVRLVWPGLAIPVGLFVVALFGTVAVRTCYGTSWIRALATHLATALLTVLTLSGLGLLSYRALGSDRLAEIAHQLGAEDVPKVWVNKVNGKSKNPEPEEPLLIATPLARAADHLGQEVLIALTDGRTARGLLLEADADSLVLREDLTGGSMSITIDFADVLQLQRVIRH